MKPMHRVLAFVLAFLLGFTALPALYAMPAQTVRAEDPDDVEFWYSYGDLYMMPEDQQWIQRDGGGRVTNGTNPDGCEFHWLIEAMTVTSENPEDGDENTHVVEIMEPTEGGIRALNLGSAELSVTMTAEDDLSITKTVDFTVYVVSAYYELRANAVDDRYELLPGGEAQLSTELRYRERTPEGNSSERIVDDLAIAWTVTEGNSLAAAVSEDNGRFVRVQGSKNGTGRVVLTPQVQLGENPAAVSYPLIIEFRVEDIYARILPGDLAAEVPSLPGTEKVIRPRFVIFRWDSETQQGVEEEVTENLRWRWSVSDPEVVEVYDAKGTLLTGPGEYVYTDASSADDPDYDGFRIRRLTPDGTEVQIAAEHYDEDREAWEVWFDQRRWVNDFWPELLMYGEEDPVRVFSNETERITLDITDLRNLSPDSSFIVEWSLGYRDEESGEFVGYPDLDPAITPLANEGNLFFADIDGETLYSLTEPLHRGGAELFAYVWNEQGTIRYAGTNLWVESRITREEYQFPEDRTLLPGGREYIDRRMHFHIENSAYPDGFDDDTEIINIEITDEQPEDPTDSFVLSLREKDDQSGWDITAMHPGTAVLTVTYSDAAGSPQSREVHYRVDHDVYRVDIDVTGSSNRGRKGSSIEMRAQAHHEQDGVGEVPVEDGEGHPTVTYVWSLGDDADEYAGISQDGDDPRLATVTFKDGFDVNGSIQVPVYVRIYDGTDPETDPAHAEARYDLFIEDSYREIVLVDAEGNDVRFDSSQEIGTAQTVRLELRSYPAADPAKEYDVIPCDGNVRWEWYNYGDDQAVILDGDGAKVGQYDDGGYVFTPGSYGERFTVCRLAEDEFRPRAGAWLYNGEDWEWIFDTELFLERRDHEIRFADPANGTFYEDGDITLELNTESLAGIPDEVMDLVFTVYTRDDEIGDWVPAQVWNAGDPGSFVTGGDGNGWQVDLSADPVTIRLDGGAFFDPDAGEPGRVSIRVSAQAVLNSTEEPFDTISPYEIARAEIDLSAARVREFYEFEHDSAIQPNYTWIIPRENPVRVENSVHPEGGDETYEVTDVQLTGQHLHGEPADLAEVTAIPDKNDPSVTEVWEIRPKEGVQEGDLEVTVTYQDLHGESLQYTFRLFIVGDFYDGQMETENDETTKAEGQSLEVSAQFVHHHDGIRDVIDGNTAGIHWYWLLAGDWNDEADNWNPDERGLASVTADPEDPSKATVLFGTLPEGENWAEVNCAVYITDDEGHILVRADRRLNMFRAEHQHQMVKENRAEPTCTAEGHTVYYRCETCGKIFMDAEGTRETTLEAQTLAKVPHTLLAQDAIPASCTEAGRTAHWKCSVCEKLFSDEGVTEISEADTAVSAKGHNYGAWTKRNDTQHQRVCANDATHVEKANHTWNAGVVTKAATESAEGVKTYTCSVCGGTKTEKIPKLEPQPEPKTVVPDASQSSVVSAIEVSGAEGIFEQGRLEVNVEDAAAIDVSSETAKLTTASVKPAVIGTFEIMLENIVGSKTTVLNQKLARPIRLVLTIPGLDPNGNYRVIRRHGTNLATLNATVSGTGNNTKLTFDNDLFSTFTVVKLEHVHTWGAWAKLDGSWHQRVCTGDASHVEKAHHTWDGGKVTTPATTAAEGVTTYTCTVCGATRTATIAKLVVDARPMYRLYMPDTHEHFYTADAYERHVLLTERGWEDEGIGWYAPLEGDPVYRLFNPYTTDHHYTKDYNEYMVLGSSGWEQEGIGWYSDPNQGVPLYRLFTNQLEVGAHHYTMDAYERSQLIAGGAWEDEGVGWYGVQK